MGAFDEAWDQVGSQKQPSNAFDAAWNQSEQAPQDINFGESVAGGFGNLLNSLTFNLGDEATSGVNALIDTIPQIAGGAGKSFGQAYDQRLADTRDIQARYRQQFPEASMALGLGGFLTPMPKALTESKGAIDTIFKGTTLGALFGGLGGYGAGEGETRAADALKGAEMGTLFGAGLSGGAVAAEKAVNSVTKNAQAIKNYIKDIFAPNLEEKAKDATLDTLQQYTDLAKLKAQLELVHPTQPPTPGTPAKPGILDDNPFASTFTTAEKVQDEGLGLLTKVYEQKIPEAGIKKAALDKARANKRSEIFKTAQGPTVSNEQVGKLIQKGLGDNADELGGVVSQAYKAAEAGDLVAPIAQAKVSIAEALAKQEKDIGPIDAYSRGVINKFLELPDNLSMSQLQYARQRVGQTIGDMSTMSNAGPEQRAGSRLLANLFGKLDEAEGASVSQAKENWLLPPGEQEAAQISAVEKARALAQQKGETFGERATGEILQKGRYGKLEMLPSDVAKTAVRSPEDARQVMKGLNYNPANTGEARQALGSNLLDELVPSMGEFNARSFANKWDKLEPAAKEVLSPETIAAVDKVKNDLIGESGFNAAVGNATKQQSTTSHRNAAASFAKDTILQAARSKTGSLGKLFEVMGSERVAKIESMVDEALVKISFDSKFAKDFLNTAPSKEVVDKISKEAIRTIVDKELLSRVTLGEISAGTAKEFSKEPAPRSEAITDTFKTEKPMEDMKPKAEELAPVKDEILDAVRKVESSDGKFLVSKAGARGAYQFMPATAKAYNVDPTDTNEEDDREGAWKLIQDEYAALGSLPLALASYNAGRRRVNQAIQMAGSRDWPEVQAALRELGLDETADYVTKYQKLGIKV